MVLLSGGIDSAVTLWWAKAQGWGLLPLTFHYFRRPSREVEAARRLTGLVGPLTLREVELPFLKDVHDLREEGLANQALLGSPEGYIPARNMVFYALAAYYAEVDGVHWVLGGHNGTDPDSFPDASPKFFNFFNSMYRIGLWTWPKAPVQILLPLSGKTKGDVVRLGLDLGVPFDATWSCYFDGPMHCGRCPSCLERRDAFRELDVPDPTGYADG